MCVARWAGPSSSLSESSKKFKMLGFVKNDVFKALSERLNPILLKPLILQNFECKDEKLSIENLTLRSDLFSDMGESTVGLPLEVKIGKIGKIEIQIPSLRFTINPFAALKVNVHDVYLLVEPIKVKDWDVKSILETERKARQEYLTKLTNLLLTTIDSNLGAGDGDGIEKNPFPHKILDFIPPSWRDAAYSLILKNINLNIK